MKSSLLKSCLLATTLLSTGASVYAASPVLYVGGKAGYATSNTKLNSDITQTAAIVIGRGETQTDLSGKGFNGGVDLGGGYFFGTNEQFYLGLNLFFTGGNVKSKVTSEISDAGLGVDVSPRTLTLERKYSLGGEAKAGILINEAVLPFIKVGVASSKWECKSSYGNTLGGLFPGQLSAKIRKNLVGFIVGGGIDIPVSDRMDVGLEYTYTQYKDTSFSYKPRATVTQNHKIKPATNEFHVTAKWKFVSPTA